MLALIDHNKFQSNRQLRYNNNMREDYFNSLDNYLDHVKKRRHQWQWLLNVITFVVVAFVTYSFINYPALQVRTIYALARPNSEGASLVSEKIDNDTNKLPNDSTPGTDSNITQSQYHEADNPPSDVPDSSIYIKKTDVKAPINWDGNSDNVQDLLSSGVVHVAGSASPGTPGNVFITGHSSDYWWTPGEYKTVFSLLDKLENGDEIVIRYQNYNFLYKVYNKEVVNKEDLGQFITTDKAQTLTLMTCYPVGTDWRRLIIQAERI